MVSIETVLVRILHFTIQCWSLPSLQRWLFNIDGRLIRHAGYFIVQLWPSHLTRTLFRQIFGRIRRLACYPT